VSGCSCDLTSVVHERTAAGLPRGAGIVAKFILLDPDIRFGKKINAAEIIPVNMANDDVGDFVGLDAREFYGFVGEMYSFEGKYLRKYRGDGRCRKGCCGRRRE
jgi:hypothetical protein